MQDREARLGNLVSVMIRCLGKLQRRVQANCIEKLKIMVISKELKAMKNPFSTNDDSEIRTVNESFSIRPTENEYLSFVASTKHDYEAERMDLEELIAQVDEKVIKEHYLEKYLNQTMKSSLKIEEFPLTDFAAKMIVDHSPQALKTIEETKYTDLWEELLVKRTSWGKPVDRMQHKPTLGAPLTKLPSSMHETALEIFNIMAKV